MKNLIIIIALVIDLFLIRCTVKKATAYELPKEMSETVRADYAKQCDRGKALYDINCAQCHNTTVKGKEIIPDFSAEELAEYDLREMNPKHSSNLQETKVTAEDLAMIKIFLGYKKKSGIHIDDEDEKEKSEHHQ